MTSYKTIDEYIASFPSDVQEILQKIRQTISKTAPEAQEAISYGLPTFKLNGNLVHFGGFKNHIGLYPAPRAIQEFKDELEQYEGSTGTIKFPLDKPIPYKLIEKIVKFRVKNSNSK